MRSALLEDRDVVSGARELLRGGQARRSRADHRDALAGANLRRFRPIQPCSQRMIDDGLLDDLDGDRRLVDAQHARRFARRGADAAGELREVVGGVQRAGSHPSSGPDRPDRSSPG